MEEESTSKLTIEQLQNGPSMDVFLSLLDVSVIDLLAGLFIFISLVILFFSLIKIYKAKKIDALKYLAIGIGIYLFAIIVPLAVSLITFIIPELFDIYEGYIMDFGNILNYAASILGTLFIIIGSIKLRKYANAL